METTTLHSWVFISVSFTTYFIVSMVYKKLGIHNLKTALLATNGLRLLNLKHILGIVLFGIVAYVIAPEMRFLLKLTEVPKLSVLLPILCVLVVVGYISNLSFQKYETQNLAVSHYGFYKARLYFIVRLVFLFFYEFFFRGVLLYKFLEFNSLTIAIIYSNILYVVIHLFDSKKEIIGAIPFGILLCVFTYLTDSIWFAFFIHLALSIIFEISIFYYQTLKTSKL